MTSLPALIVYCPDWGLQPASRNSREIPNQRFSLEGPQHDMTVKLTLFDTGGQHHIRVGFGVYCLIMVADKISVTYHWRKEKARLPLGELIRLIFYLMQKTISNQIVSWLTGLLLFNTLRERNQVNRGWSAIACEQDFWFGMLRFILEILNQRVCLAGPQHD